jgi:hypothetical protein
MSSTIQTASVQAALGRCLRSPYLAVDESRRGQVQSELDAARQLYEQALASFTEDDEATGLKQVWAAVYRSARALAYKAGYRVDQLECLETVLRVHYPAIGDEEIAEMRRAQELVGTREVAIARARRFMEKVASLV